ncbi:polyprenyl synthetase family protein [Deinococcus wulumuqiensis]
MTGVFAPRIPSPLTGLAVPDAAFEARMREVLRSDVEFIALIGEDLVTAGGKRVRPLVTLLAAQALGGRPDSPRWDGVLRLSVCVELLHSASLLHDDLIDDSDRRRGQETAFRRFGNVVSVMSGDFMLARLLGELSTMPGSPALTRAFGQAASVICEGEVLQFQVASYADYSFENYFQVIHGKTAALLELAAQAPALLLGAPEAEREALLTFGREYGMAFQMQDDLLDLLGEEAQIGKPVGGDLREGKATYPVLLLLEGESGAEVREILERRAAQPGDVERVVALARQEGADVRTHAEIRRRVGEAVAALGVLPPSPAREALAALAGREIERTR